jgi:uroporphyrin-III C-methyltransferase
MTRNIRDGSNRLSAHMTAHRSDSLPLGANAVSQALEVTRSVLANEPRLVPGHVWLVGAGPSDPSQLTLQAVAALAQADVVVHDALVDARILELLPAAAERIFVGKRGGRPSIAQAEICERLIALARGGRRVIRLKGGDPYVFARGGEEVLALAQAGIPFRVIPGMTSGLAALTAAAIPATLRGVNQSLVLITGHESDVNAAGAPDWKLLAKLAAPLVIYMALRNIGVICEALMAEGMRPEVPAAVIAAAGAPAEQVIVATLADIAQRVAASNISAPAIFVVGDIIAHRAALQEALAESQRAAPLNAPRSYSAGKCP